MEQKRTGYIYNWKNGHIQMRNHAETGTVTGVSIGINRCRGEGFYAWFRIFFIAIPENNAIKTVQQSAKDKEDICRRADARQRYLTQDFTL